MYAWNYDEMKPLLIETDASGVGCGAALLQTRSNNSSPRDEAPDNSILRPFAFTINSLTVAEKRYSNIEREALSILYRLEKFYHYCFTREVSIITDHKPLIEIFQKDVATSSQRLQRILLRIHKFRMGIIYKLDQIYSQQTGYPDKSQWKEIDKALNLT